MPRLARGGPLLYLSAQDAGSRANEQLNNKARLAGRVRDIIAKNRWTQGEAARRLSLSQGAVSKICRGKLEAVGELTLMECLVLLGEEDAFRLPWQS